MKIINNLPQLLDVQRQLDNIDSLLGIHDISNIGDGTVTGTIYSLKEELAEKSNTSHNHDERYVYKNAIINTNNVTEAGYALDARQANPNISGSLGEQISSLNKTFSQQISNLNNKIFYTMGQSFTVLVNWYSSSGNESVIHTVDLSSYRYLVVILKYGDTILDTRMLPITVFKMFCPSTTKGLTLYEGGTGRVEVRYVSDTQIYIFTNAAYYPVIICGIK